MEVNYFYVDCNPGRRGQTKMHAHEQPEIIFYLEGSGRLETDSGAYPFEPGQAVVMPPNMQHRSLSAAAFSSISVCGPFSQLIMKDSPVLLWDNEQGDGAYLAQLLYRSRHAEGQFLSDLVSAYVRFWVGQAGKVGATEAAVTRVYQEISYHAYDKDIDIAGILDASGYAQDYIRMLFRKRYGAAPVKFLTRIRIEHACFLLSSYKDSMSLAEVAENVGYDDYVYFSKSFKAVTGVSPRNYLKTKNTWKRT